MSRFKLTSILLLILAVSLYGNEKVKVLIIDGRNNHDWEKTTESLVGTLNESGRFVIGVSSAPAWNFKDRPKRPHHSSPEIMQKAYQVALKQHQKEAKEYSKTLEGAWSRWKPDFSKYDTIVMNYNGQSWPEPMQQDFLKFVHEGGGVVLIHAANNAFGHWEAFNELIGIGWRKAGFGQCVTIDSKTGETIQNNCENGSGHGSKHPFQVTVRESSHPIMKGIPRVWMHGSDELYHHMRGPAANMTILSSAYSDPKQRGTGEHEPITWEVSYGQGKVIVTSMGHFWRDQTNYDSLNCVGFQTIFSRSVEYAGTGTVSLPVPKNFPKSDSVSLMEPNKSPSLVARARKYENPYCMLTPEQELSTFVLPEGYVAELVASEPQVEEPVLTVWDSDGAMYVAEMRSYMQDADGTGTKTLKNGRVKRLEDTNGDGKYDKVSVFIDGLNLPRMILPLEEGWIAVRETDTTDVMAYRDLDEDGVAEEKKVLYAGGPQGRNGPGKSVEHQDSGLVWNQDNYIYVTYNSERYRYTDGSWKVEKTPGHWTQWGLSNDDLGRLYWVHNSGPLCKVEIHPKYWKTVSRLAQKGVSGVPIDIGAPYQPEFMQVKSLVTLNDRGGSAQALRGFTSACGQSVFRGTALHKKDYGTYFVCDPTIHVVRQANITRQHGKIMLEKTQTGEMEFLRSTDINSRFVNTATGPDGCLYVTDMYRGIIQDAPWMNPNARAFTRKSGLADNRQHGRIWRIRHVDAKREKVIKASKLSTLQLVEQLKVKNGWRRDASQKELILRKDRESALPALRELLKGNQSQAKIHAIWSLEGMSRATLDDLNLLLEDTDPNVRLSSIKVAESVLEPSALLKFLIKFSNELNPRVAEQVILSAGLLDAPSRIPLIEELALRFIEDRAVMLAASIGLWGMKDLDLVKNIKNGMAFSNVNPADQGRVASEWTASVGNWDRGLKFPETMSNADKRHIQGGETQYFKHCATCHGPDGKGTKVPGTDLVMAPSLFGSARVQGEAHQFIPIMINGLTGPLDGKTYAAGFMAPAKALGITRDDRLAELLSYIRYAWGQEGSVISKELVSKIRRQHEARQTPWTQQELLDLKP